MRAVHVVVAAPMLAGFALSCGCATVGSESRMGPPLRNAVDPPERFVPVTATEARDSPSSCRSPIQDPRDGSTLKLTRSANGQGDYEIHPLPHNGVPAC